VLTLQNGLGNAETIAEALGPDRVLAGVTYRGGELRQPGVVAPTGPDKETIVGELDGPATERVAAVVATFNAAGIRALPADDVRREIWGKFVVNVAGNALSAITGLRLGQLLGVDPSRHLVERIVEEVVLVATALGVGLPYPDPMARLRENWGTLLTAKSSMLQDLEKGRRTEIDALNGFVVREGERLGIPVPYNAAATLLVRTLEGAHDIAAGRVTHATA
jgi:2-dehydropantoate 2-reductase